MYDPFACHHRISMLIAQTSSKPFKVTPDPTPGYIYLYSEEGMSSQKLDKPKLTSSRTHSLLLA
jgi:hypothetical protein